MRTVRPILRIKKSHEIRNVLMKLYCLSFCHNRKWVLVLNIFIKGSCNNALPLLGEFEEQKIYTKTSKTVQA